MPDRVVVTGASGLVASHLVRALLERGDDVVAIVGPASDPWRIADVLEHVEIVRADVRSLRRDAAGRADVVLHLAAAGLRPDEAPSVVVETNVLGTLRTLELAAQAGARRFVYCGSGFEYGPGECHSEVESLRPLSEYGASKAAGGLIAHAFERRVGLEVVTVRPFTVYGPYEAAYRLVPSTLLAALDGGPVEITSGTQTRDFLWIGDAVDGLLAAADVQAAAGEMLNLCTGIATPVRTVAELAAQVAGTGAEVRVGALPDRAVEYDTLSGDATRAKAVLGWEARVSLREGLARTAEWLGRERHRFREYVREATRT